MTDDAPHRPHAGPHHGPHGSPHHPGALPGTTTATTTGLRPVRERRSARTAGALVCLVLGLGLIGGAVAGSWLVDDPAASPASQPRYADVRSLWHSVPVDTLFPRTINGEGAGPGGADRVWTRVAVAPDGPCAGAFDPLLLKALRPVGCLRVLRATYTDATASGVTTVGMVVAEADRDAMTDLYRRFSQEDLDERADLMPRTYPVPGTVAAGFGDRQRASWTVSVLTDAPVVVFAVSGFADGRPVAEPVPAAEATVPGDTSAAAQAGLGHEARGIADRVERALRESATSRERPE
ncbi:hypothetical protein SSP531S_32510 [Streptomyces spongiicola]|uniref:PknH-like extracellular domain-containing protein n=1 Tax=Streptomyces spongiicola TaxID=1690221 RepID=A0A2S1YUY3_9ACTN|nr:hypothetical protein [Streptomyces spongiicola]AWK07813.1 hypothetical protein DDQ41_01545 [Streptomyces spongiicola]GBQ01804.1 hypothetical protein SSP531S_32510 [Streptomyces spongiicola]